jgi:Shedu protein SduA, C-terminal
MSIADDQKFFELRKEGKTYISKLFKWNTSDQEGKRNVTIVFESSDEQKLGELTGALCLRVNGQKRKTQVTALVSQDNNGIKRLTLQTFKNRTTAGEEWFEAIEKDEFTFRPGEFERLLDFLQQIKFVDLTNEERFQIEDISTQSGPKMIVDAQDKSFLKAIKNLSPDDRQRFLAGLHNELSTDDVNTLLGRKQGLTEFEEHFAEEDWSESEWQNFFEHEQWVFGYGLDYRIMKAFDREVTVSSSGTDNKEKPIVDFLQSFTDYTVLLEIKLPNTPIFRPQKGGRSGTWEFSRQFVSAVSQVLEQKAEWLASAQTGDKYTKDGQNKLTARTRNTKTILVIGSSHEFSQCENVRDREIMKDTFELFRLETRSIDIITYDELLERAQFITRK